MKTFTRKSKEMSEERMVKEALKAGYYYSKNKGGNKVVCPECGNRTAIVFHGSKQDVSVKYSKIYACKCGVRVLFPKNSSNKRYCQTDGCNAILPPSRVRFCYKCIPQGPNELNTNARCKTAGCNAILPKGRMAYCYNCRAYQPKNKNKEVESTNINM